MSHVDPERRREYKQEYYQLNKEKFRKYSREYSQRKKRERSKYNHQYLERLKRGEIKLPPLDWAICERGGSSAQARAHYRRGEKPCANCRRAAAADARYRKSFRKQGRVAA
jgi:hypothetical protein